MLAHIFGMPLEEYALSWVGGAGASIFIVFASAVCSRLLQRRMK